MITGRPKNGKSEPWPDSLPFNLDTAVSGISYHVARYRPRIEGLFARIERWTNVADPSDVHWRSISKENILTVYGKDAGSRIANPASPQHIFTWLICETRDDKGNAAVYEYAAEDGAGADLSRAHERNRGDANDPPSQDQPLFDIEYPGHHLRRIKSVSVTVPCVTGPYTGVPCPLTLVSSRTRVDPIATGDYAFDAAVEDDRFQIHTGAIESIIISGGGDDAGLFAADHRDERYLPFEGAGADSDWNLKLTSAVPTHLSAFWIRATALLLAIPEHEVSQQARRSKWEAGLAFFVAHWSPNSDPPSPLLDPRLHMITALEASAGRDF